MTLIILAAVIGYEGISAMISDVADMRTSVAAKTNAVTRAQPDGLPTRSRYDRETDRAVADALEMLRRPATGSLPSEDVDRLGDALRPALARAPHDAFLWLGLAALETGRAANSSAGAEPLKMAYFTAPNDAQLMPVRLEIATRMSGLIDVQLKQLAEGDVRLMLMRQPDQRAAVISAYRRASSQGKTFLEDAVRATDPSFLKLLRG
ncbi:hypothetical protein [Bradyrhizobium sp.]|uniref:hypothetical protein n=1 Tax=Bradyrhizobium sp. TaxID=376 RepID=UPI002DDD75F1|nr:hypothetical protein [Bradyrhizobium sp.]HEV2154440.1 hypothetical protein [Bradyrhizobium sp.]